MLESALIDCTRITPQDMRLLDSDCMKQPLFVSTVVAVNVVPLVVPKDSVVNDCDESSELYTVPRIKLSEYIWLAVKLMPPILPLVA